MVSSQQRCSRAQCSSDLCSLLLWQVSKLVVITETEEPILKCEFISVASYLTPGVVPENTRCCCQFSEANILTGDFGRGGFGLPQKKFLLFNKRECRYKAETPPHHAFFTWIGTLQQQWIFHKWDLITDKQR